MIDDDTCIIRGVFEFGIYFVAVISRKLWGITYALFMGLGTGTKTKIPEG